ncbi:hypothetical protein D3C76_470620 [compost metagenome]
MTIVKWTVSPYSKPARQEYCKETEHFYMHAKGRGRDSKVSSYYKYFDSEAEALEYIRQREENKAEQKRVDQIKRHAVELLEAAERYLDFRHTGDIGMGHQYSGEHPQTQLKNVIAKAKGVA